MTENLLYKCENISFEYLLGNQKVLALKEISFEVKVGDFVCFSGPSGSGKSTLLNVLGLIEPIQKGQIIFNGEDLLSLKEKKLNYIRRYQLGFIFQTFNLIDVLTAEENVEYFLVRQRLRRSERKHRVEDSLKSVGLWEHRNKKPMEMSGGQRQRVAIARAIAKKPNVLIADEPTASLDQKTGSEIVDILVKLNKEKNITVITASHDHMVLSKVPSNRKMVDGRIIGQEVNDAP